MVVLAAALIALADPATADNFALGNPNVECDTSYSSNVCLADNAVHTVSIEDLGPLMEAATRDTLFNSYDTTRLEVRCCFGHGSTIDVYYYSGSTLPPNARAAHRCVSAINSEVCNHAHVQYSSSLMPTGGSSYDTSLRKAVACHETGHSVGLTHGPDAHPVAYTGDTWWFLYCMYSPARSDSPYLGGHNVGHIDGYY